MELKEFISETIKGVIAGIADGQQKGATVRAGGRIDFDIAVTTKETSDGGVKGKISVLALGSFSASNKSLGENSTVSRIKFSVDVETNQ